MLLHVLLFAFPLPQSHHARHDLSPQMNENENEALPPFESYEGPYDIYKRRSEDLINEYIAEFPDTANATHLRISGILSNPYCVQMGALTPQMYVGCRIGVKIDFNSSRNVSAAIRLLIDRFHQGLPCSSIYYYTRPLSMKSFSYGDMVQQLRESHEILLGGLWLPVLVVQFFVALIHLISALFGWIFPVFNAWSYMAAVSQNNHTFSNKRFCTDFGADLTEVEENLKECFGRIRRRAAVINS